MEFCALLYLFMVHFLSKQKFFEPILPGSACTDNIFNLVSELHSHSHISIFENYIYRCITVHLFVLRRNTHLYSILFQYLWSRKSEYIVWLVFRNAFARMHATFRANYAHIMQSPLADTESCVIIIITCNNSCGTDHADDRLKINCTHMIQLKTSIIAVRHDIFRANWNWLTNRHYYYDQLGWSNGTQHTEINQTKTK